MGAAGARALGGELMACEIIQKPGVTIIVCSRGLHVALCEIPGCGFKHSKLCDYRVMRNGVAGTCDLKLCQHHARSVGPDRDYCPAHLKLSQHELRGD